MREKPNCAVNHAATKEATMKTRHVIGLSMLAGVALGAIAVQGLNAQAKPPVYFVVDINEVTDPEGWKAVGGRSNAAAAALLKDFGGHYISRTDNITALDGTTPTRFVITRFASVEKAKAWYNSPAQKKVNEIRMKATKSRAFIVEGI
jgi:uncharacterized protein (DUF1330 family)